jgi:hypothetical protein
MKCANETVTIELKNGKDSLDVVSSIAVVANTM